MAQVKTSAASRGAFYAAVTLVVIASLIGNTAVSWLLGPLVLILGIVAIMGASLIDTMCVLMFCALALENPSENTGAGMWRSPFHTFGGMILTHWKTIIGGPWFFGGMDVALICAMVVAYLRSSRRTAAERALGTPRPMVKLAYLSLVTVVYVFIVGKLRPGGDQSMAVWQADKVTYLPIVFLLFGAALQGPQDHIKVGKVLLLAGVLRALQAMYVKAVVVVKPDPITGDATLVYATSHNDSITFALAAVVLCVLLLERAGKKATRLVWICAPILIGGMLANNRRMVWVQIIFVLAAVYIMTERNALKRKLERILMILAPFVALYVAAGWGSTAKIFKPVAVIYSAVDTKNDTSTLWREIENYDLIETLRNTPIFGLGYGHKFWEVIPLPAVDYALEYYLPHNSLLGLWAFYGLIGVIGITSLWAGGVYFAMRGYHHAKQPLDRAAALTAYGSVFVYLVQCYGDLGLGCWQGVFTAAPGIAVACRIAVLTGAWSNTPVKGRVAPARGTAEPGAQASNA